MKSMAKILSFIKHRAFLLVSLAIMLLSFTVTLPTGEMIVNLEWNGLCMILIMSLALTGLFKEKALYPLKLSADIFEHTAALLLFLAAASYILSMFITSLAASIFLIPLSIAMLEKKERDNLIPGTAALIAISANAGGMILPSGSMQNMLLNRALPEGSSFIMTMLPFALLAIPVILLMIPAILGRKISERVYIHGFEEEEIGAKGMRMMYICLILVAIISSFGLFRWQDILIFTIAILVVFDRKVFLKTDYTLFLSMFFLSIAGSALSPLLSGNALAESIAVSEILGSGAGAAITLPAASNAIDVLIGSNIGSFGTLASPAAFIALMTLIRRGRKEAGIFTLYYTASSILIIIVSLLLLTV